MLIHGQIRATSMDGAWPDPWLALDLALRLALGWPLAWPLAWPWLAHGLALAGPWPGPGWPLARPWLALGLARPVPVQNSSISDQLWFRLVLVQTGSVQAVLVRFAAILERHISSQSFLFYFLLSFF